MAYASPPRNLSHTAVYFLNRQGDPSMPTELQMWGHALLTTELRVVPKRNLIGENQRKRYLQMVNNQLIVYTNVCVGGCIFF